MGKSEKKKDDIKKRPIYSYIRKGKPLTIKRRR